MSNKAKDLTFKTRIRLIRGCNEAFYLSMVDYKKTWEGSMFYASEDLVRDELQKGKLKTHAYPEVDGSCYAQEVPSAAAKPFHAELSFFLNSAPHKVQRLGETVSLQGVSRKGHITHTGGSITSAKWLPLPLDAVDAEYQFLAVSCIHSTTDDLASLVNHRELSMFRKSPLKQLRSSIQIYAYHLPTDSLSVHAIYDTTLTGATKDLSWVPVHASGFLGILSGTFTDGGFHMFAIDKDASPDTTQEIRPCASFYVPSCSFTCYDFIGSDKVLIGTIDGYVYEYVLPHTENYEPTPSSASKVSDSSISMVFCVEVEPSQFLVSVISRGTDAIVYEYDKPIRSKAVPIGRPSFRPTYNRSVHLVLFAGSADTLTYNFFRYPQEPGNCLLRVDDFLTCIHASERLGHPVSLTGTAGGAVISMNYARKFLNGSKTTNRSLVPLQLWGLHSKDGNLHVDASYTAVSVDAQQQHPVAPLEVSISSLAWNDNVAGSSVYVAGTSGGLLIIERLDRDA